MTEKRKIRVVLHTPSGDRVQVYEETEPGADRFVQVIDEPLGVQHPLPPSGFFPDGVAIPGQGHDFKMPEIPVVGQDPPKTWGQEHGGLDDPNVQENVKH